MAAENGTCSKSVATDEGLQSIIITYPGAKFALDDRNVNFKCLSDYLLNYKIFTQYC
jgi:hypothetical protein